MTTQSTFAVGNTVQIIDREENPAEWASFIIIGEEVGHYLLKPVNKSIYDEPLWVVPEEICLVNLQLI